MNKDRRQQALMAAKKAYEARKIANLPLDGPCCVYDLVENAGVEIRFSDLPSMEGIYYPAKPAIIISSLRPSGRQAFTCAHEFGHHVFGHGEQFDELLEERESTRKYDPKEFDADCFAGALLMPKTAVLKALSDRDLRPATVSPDDLYAISSWFGVGYLTLIHHMCRVLDILPTDHAKKLEHVRLPTIRQSLLGFQSSAHLAVADAHWSGRPIDAQVSDLILLPPDVVIEGECIREFRRDSKKVIASAERPGIGRVLRPGSKWASYVRVSKHQFVGLARFRHLEETDDE
jgi:Zn-dependent peptidase ImmA (M78 family)